MNLQRKIEKKETISTAERPGVYPHEREEVFNQGFLEESPKFLQLSYYELEKRNLEIKKDRTNGVSRAVFEEKFLDVLRKEQSIKAVIVCFTDLEGKLQFLDYDKKFILDSYENLTFDGSSIKGFTAQNESDLRLKLDWSSFRWLPADIFGAGKVLLFANVCDKDGNFYKGDFRSCLAKYCAELKEKMDVNVNIATEIEGFLFKGINSEQHFTETKGFDLATESGYFNCLPQDDLRKFIDKLAEVQRALGFENEKDHPEVAPSQFELNFKYSIALNAADQVQLYKLTARQVAKSMGYTVSFLPKPVSGMNGNGMHTNISLGNSDENLFYDESEEDNLSEMARRFLTGILYYANDLCLVLNSSVNSYRRLDPAYEAPNEIKVSNIDRGSMIRIPIGNKRSARIEVRTVAPDANPYLVFFALLKAGMTGVEADESQYKEMKNISREGDVKKLPVNIYQALKAFSASAFMREIMGEKNNEKYFFLKKTVADRCPRSLGMNVKSPEVLYHHEITNQKIWADF